MNLIFIHHSLLSLRSDLALLIKLWGELESLSSIKSLGLCDVEKETLEELSSKVEHKPSIITVRQIGPGEPFSHLFVNFNPKERIESQTKAVFVESMF